MITTITILLLLLTVTLSMGGGLYEVLVIYPNWKRNVDPFTLADKLESSGQNNASKRFWPLVSPAQSLLAIINIILAWKYTGAAHCYWLSAATIVFVSRIITFSYFIPVMLRKIMQPGKMEAIRLRRIVKQWTALSPLRLIAELAAWILLCITLMHL
jgi:hypothetical protein